MAKKTSAAAIAKQYAIDRELAANAAVVLDALLAYRVDRQIRPMLIEFVKASIRLHADQFPRRHFRAGSSINGKRHRHARLHGWHGKLGLVVEYGHGEHHYVCVFCDDNLATFNNTGKSIPHEIVTRLERHGWECALRYLMQRGEGCSHLSDSMWPGPGRSSEPCPKCGRYYVDE